MNVIVFKGPNRRASGRAAKLENVARILVVKNSEPSAEGEMPWRVVKKYVSQEGEARPEAKESRAKRKIRRRSMLMDFGEI